MDPETNQRPRPIHLLDDDEYWYAGDEELSKEFDEEPDFQPQTSYPIAGEDASPQETASPLPQPIPEAPLSMDELAAKYPAIVKHNIFQIAGDDDIGRPVIAFSMSRVPPRTEINHQELLQFMKQMIDRIVENDYTIVYFHYGLNSKNKPSLKWAKQLYQELDRKYKKNLKNLLLVHPTNFIKVVMKVFGPLISTKFGKKVNYINRLDELKGYLRLEKLDIPPEVLKHDQQLGAKLAVSNSIFHHSADDLKNKQFGVTVSELRERTGDEIPVVVQMTIDFITKNALDVEGIFRRSAQSNVMAEAVATFNSGQTPVFTTDHVHLPPALLKKFLRDLPEPLLTFQLYDKVMESCSLPEEQRLSFTDEMLNQDLPQENRMILIFLLQFLELVIDHSDGNRMNSGSLAIVFGPNLLWSQSEVSTLTSMSKINSFTKYIIDNANLIFDESAV
jgi:hypothetical protein